MKLKNNISQIGKISNLEKIEVALPNKKRNLNKRHKLFDTCRTLEMFILKFNVHFVFDFSINLYRTFIYRTCFFRIVLL